MLTTINNTWRGTVSKELQVLHRHYLISPHPKPGSSKASRGTGADSELQRDGDLLGTVGEGTRYRTYPGDGVTPLPVRRLFQNTLLAPGKLDEKNDLPLTTCTDKSPALGTLPYASQGPQDEHPCHMFTL